MTMQRGLLIGLLTRHHLLRVVNFQLQWSICVPELEKMLLFLRSYPSHQSSISLWKFSSVEQDITYDLLIINNRYERKHFLCL